MTRPIDEERTRRDRLTAPCRAFKRTPGCIPVKVPTTVDGRGIDQREALALLAGRRFAKLLRYLGTSQGMLWFEYDPAKLPPLEP